MGAAQVLSPGGCSLHPILRRAPLPLPWHPTAGGPAPSGECGARAEEGRRAAVHIPWPASSSLCPCSPS